MHTPFMAQVLGRKDSLFGEDFSDNLDELKAKIQDSRILVVGAAGSIGSAFVKQLIDLKPRRLCLVDPSENNLVELVRDLRSSALVLPEDFSTYCIAMGSLAFHRFMVDQSGFDAVVNFSALKHVRSERDPYSLMRMIETNVLVLENFLQDLASHPPGHFFSVSSDKAVHPASLMGATKAFMERLMEMHGEGVPYSSARFANVAFSDGSLTHGFLHRLEKGQPLSAPTDVRRYFISHEEAGQLCLLACFLGENGDIFIPKLDPEADLKSFADLAMLLLRDRGFEPELFEDEAQAREFAQGRKPGETRWPCCFSLSDTSGEKPYEEFFSPREQLDMGRFKAMAVVTPPPLSPEPILNALEGLNHMRHAEVWEISTMERWIKMAVPELDHRTMDKNLDQKM